MRYRFLSLFLSLLLVLSVVVPVSAVGTVEVFVTLSGEPLAGAVAAAGGIDAYLADAAGLAAYLSVQDELNAASAAIGAIPGTEVLGQSWFLTRSLAVRLPENRLDALSALDGVVSVEIISSLTLPEPLSSDPSDHFSTAPIYASDLLELDTLHRDGIQGEGVVAAVIDSGFDLDHPVFSMPKTAEGRLRTETVASLFPLLSASAKQSLSELDPASLWISEKIPFAYDYADNDTDVSTTDIHGTHVASILGGGADADGDYVGIAPAVQLLLMKVFGDGTEAVSSEYAVYRAFEDAILLGADVISLSIGVTAGYSYSTNTFSLEKHINRARELGCAVICAMGNDGSVGRGSAYDVEGGTDLPLTKNPDYGLTADPASFAGTLAVGAYTPDRIMQSGIGAGDGSIFSFTDTAADQGYPDMKFRTVFEGKTIAFVPVPGIGRPEDYASLDVKDKLVLVRRGEISFTEKLQAAAEAGAVGMLCYDNVKSDTRFSMALDAMPIPAVSLSLSDGERLASLPTDKRTITVSENILRVSTPASAGLPADYSTRGSGLTIRPSLLSPGGVYAAIPGGEYAAQNGTSMATPVISGIVALALGEKKIHSETEWNADALDAILADLITTAEPILDGEGHPYSVRVQGGGKIRTDLFLSPHSLLRAVDGRGVIELGDGLSPTDGFSFTVTLSNPSDKSHTYTVSASAASDGYILTDGEDTVFAADTLRIFDLASICFDQFSANRYSRFDILPSITLAAGESRTLTFTVSLAEKEAAEYAKYFPNGYYLEGYVFAVREDGEVLSLPYLGFAGDFDALPYLDEFSYDGEDSFFAQNCLLGYAGETLLCMGGNYYDDHAVMRRDLLAISPNGDGCFDEALINLYLLRNLYAFDIVITDENGTVIKTAKREYYLRKTYFNDTKNALTAPQKTVWNGEDSANVGYVMPDGNYTVTFRVLGFGDTVLEEISLPLVVDTQVPEILRTELTEKNGKRHLSVTLRDNHYPMRAVLYRNATDAYGRETVLYRDAHNISYKEGRRSITLIYDITDFEGDYLYLDLYDYAMNQITHQIPLS